MQLVLLGAGQCVHHISTVPTTDIDQDHPWLLQPRGYPHMSGVVLNIHFRYQKQGGMSKHACPRSGSCIIAVPTMCRGEVEAGEVACSSGGVDRPDRLGPLSSSASPAQVRLSFALHCWPDWNKVPRQQCLHASFLASYSVLGSVDAA